MSKNKKNWANPVYWQSADYNWTLFQFFLQELEGIAMSRFRWTNLPPKVDQRFLEYTLLKQGIATISWPDGLVPENAFAMQAVTESAPDANYNYPKWMALGINGVKWQCEAHKNGVIVWDNMNRTIPTSQNLKIFARELADITRTMQMIRMHMRVPYIITGPKSQEQAMRSIWAQIANGEPAVLTYDNFSDIQINVLQTETTSHTDDLPKAQAHYDATWNAALRYLGLRVSTDKAARQTADEIVQQNDLSDMSALSFIEPRRQACEMLNELTGGDASIEWNKDVESISFNALSNAANFIEGAEIDTDTGTIE